MKNYNQIIIIVLLILFNATIAISQTIYVKHDAVGTNNGTSWTNAYTNIQDAIDAAIFGNEIWVAAGTYYPTKDISGNTSPADNRDKAFFVMTENIKIYGGFVGTETLLSQRNVTNNTTTLSGDLGQDDVATPSSILNGSWFEYTNTNDNAYHVLQIRPSGNFNISANTVVDGFTIIGGNATGNNFVHEQYGGGIYITSNANGFCNPTISNCILEYNNAVNGAGIYNHARNTRTINATITNCTFEKNGLNLIGGSIYNDVYNGTANPTLKNCIFKNNDGLGSGVCTIADENGIANPTIINALFYDNVERAVVAYGLNTSGSSSSTVHTKITNCTFYNNIPAATNGGAIWNRADNGCSSTMTITNSILWSNGTNADMNNIANGTGTATITFNHNIYDDGTIDGTIVLPSGVSGSNNLEQNPLFTNTASGDFTLQNCSPAINTGDGNNGNSVNTETVDLGGNARFYNNGGIDLGAYEKVITSQRIYVNPSAAGANNGTSWTDAYTSLQSALTNACTEDEIWLKAGTYYPTQEFDFDNSGGTNSREKTFYINKSIAIYGGFAGTETQRSERNPTTNITILSGDIGTLNDNTDNAHHIIYVGNINETVVNLTIDGLTISDANANVGTGFWKHGGGIHYNANRNSQTINATINQCIFTNNYADDGAGISFIAHDVLQFNTTITKTKFHNNTALSKGGGINYTMLNSATLTGTIENSVFYSNTCGEGVVALYADEAVSNLTIMNNTFSKNTATIGGAAIIYGEGNSATPSTNLALITITNTIVWSNNGAISAREGIQCNMTFDYGIYDDGTPDGTVTFPMFNVTGSNNSDLDPLFANAVSDNFNLLSASPAKDVGTLTNAPNSDINGFPCPIGSGIDIGAFETPLAIYVNKNAAGANNGTSWTDAYTNLQTAIDNNDAQVDIWVAAATYYPTHQNSADSRDYSFYISKDNTKIYGGFAGTETAFSQRNITANLTILSGDLGALNNNTDNAYHVVYIDGSTANGSITNNTVLDGLIIQDGNANNSSVNYAKLGGGIFNFCGATGQVSNPIISNCIIKNNETSTRGAGLANENYNLSNNQIGECRPIIKNTAFTSNVSQNHGGILSNFANGGTIETTLINCLINNNNGPVSGIYNYSQSSGISTTTLTNCTITGNTSVFFIGPSVMLNDGTGSNSTFTNCILWSNGQNVVSTANSAPYSTINNCIYDDGNPDGTVNLAPASGVNNLDSDPLFVNAAGGDYTLQNTSPALDVGDNAANTETLDLAQNTRINNMTIDLGAYEYQLVLPVELLSFTATLTDENMVQLDWQTATEINNAHFEVEWSTNGVDFERIGTVNGAGTTTDVHPDSYRISVKEQKKIHIIL